MAWLIVDLWLFMKMGLILKNAYQLSEVDEKTDLNQFINKMEEMNFSNSVFCRLHRRVKMWRNYIPKS